ncbi:hypothetical protein F4780DRAFT_773925 [Xylariomycetidae sp. FL0641]|nr:hypothetical protein F4780DRAFT_773925 [Xylariomycetidae sp. FL0641]
MAPATVSVVYPAGTKFDMDYYLSTHMPLVQSTWTSFGLKSWKVAKYTNDGAAYVVQAWLEWEHLDQWAKASQAPEAKKVFDDIAKFSDQSPQILAGEVMEAKSC